MAITVAELVAKVVADTSAASSGFQSFGRSMTSVGRDMTVGLTLPIVGAGAAIVNTGVQFDTSLRRIIGLTDVTAEEIGGVESAILNLAGEVGKTPQELADGFYFLASAGFDTKEALEVLTTAGQASAAGLGETQDIAKVLGATINAYGHDNISAAGAADILTQAIKDGTAEASEFATSLQYVIPTAAAMGVSFEDVTAAIAGMTLGGTDASTATTNLNQVFASLLKPTKEASETLKDLGLSAGGIRQQLEQQGLLATLETLRQKFGGNEAAMAKVFGNVRALRGVLGLLNLDADQLQKVFGDTANATGTLQQAFEETEGPGRDMARAQAELDKVLIDLGRTVIPIVVDVMTTLAGVLEDVGEWWASLDPGMQDFIVKAAMVAAVLGPALVILGTLALALGALIGPVGAVVAAIAILGLAVVQNFDKIKEWIGNTWQFIVDVFNNGVAFLASIPAKIGEFLTGIVRTVVEFGANVVRVVTAAFKEFLSKPAYYLARLLTLVPSLLLRLGVEIVKFLVSMVGNVAKWFGQAVTTAVRFVSSLVGQVIDWFARLPGRVASLVQNVVSSVVRWFSELPGKVVAILGQLVLKMVSFFVQLPGKLWSAVTKVGKAIVEGIWNGISGLGGWLWNQVTGFVDGIIDNVLGAFGIDSPSKVFAWIGQQLVRGLGEGFDDGLNRLAPKMATATEGLVPSIGAPSGTAVGPSVALGGSGGGNVNVVLYADRYMGTQAEADYYAGMVARNLQFNSRRS